MTDTGNKTANHHFFLSSVARWMTTGPDRNLTEAIRMMGVDKLTFTIWYVPVEPTTEYEINFFAPQVPGAHPVETVQFQSGRRVKA